jgi:hypothetical protein
MSGVRRGVNEFLILLGYAHNCLIFIYQPHIQGSGSSRKPLKFGPTDCPRKLETKYQTVLQNILEARKFQRVNSR